MKPAAVPSTQPAARSPSGSPADGGARPAVRRPLVVASALLGAAAVLSQVAYPLVDGVPRAHDNPTLVVVTALTVVLFAAASVTHAAATFGARAALTLVVVAGGIGLVAEAGGVATGFPFGSYSYTGSLGPQVLHVPVLVPLAWVMMAYPCLLAGRVVARSAVTGRAVAGRAVTGREGRRGPRRQGVTWLLTVAASAWLLASWDLFLDPQMVQAGHWHWRFPEPGLPGVPGVPLTNAAGWLLVSAVIQAALHSLIPRGAPHRDRSARAARVPAVPAALLAWTWLGSTLANLAFFDRPAVAAYGFVAMGLVAAPALAGWLRR